ncbi:MAG: SAM-dependent methyltransferase [Bryobacteraceae bacterium]|nr:SAM-dependent methyltransferase [Bryobacteraceae bacterium]
MTPAGEKIAFLIRRGGPLRFAEFMETALYDVECGYYTSGRKVFGREGDFYTSEQIQPVFGRLVAAAAEKWKQECAGEFHLAEWGAGRGEMEEQLGGFNYAAVDRGRDGAPLKLEGAVFSNELFDALAVDAAKRSQGVWRLMRVGLEDGEFVWTEGEELAGEWLEYALRAGSFIEDEEAWIELPVELRRMLAEIDSRLVRGRIVAVDYGYSERELRRFPAGTLMAYRKHRASCEVLRNPGEQDITAHVPLTYLMESAAAMGWRDGRLRTLSQWILEECGESGVERAVAAESETEKLRLRLKLKTLLFGMGESFRVAEWNKLA